MPSVTVSNPNLQMEGPVVEVQFLLPKELEARYLAENKPLPEPVKVRALIDTGATNCAVQEDIPQKLGLQPIDTKTISTPSGDIKCYLYFMRMLIPTHNIITEGAFTAVPGLVVQHLHCLLGRDLLAHGELLYQGKLNQFILTL